MATKKTGTPPPEPPTAGTLTPLLTVPDVCRLLKLSRASLYRLERDGRLIPIRVRKSAPRWREQDIEAYLNSCRGHGERT